MSEKQAQNKTPKAIKGMNKHETDANDEKVYFMALGGLEHIGQNMYVYKYRGKYLVVDCGMGFLDEEIGAGDVQYCDTTWLEKRKKDVVGFIVTVGSVAKETTFPIVTATSKTTTKLTKTFSLNIFNIFPISYYLTSVHIIT